MKLATVGILVLAVAMIMATIPLVACGGGDFVLCNMTNDGLNACKPSVSTKAPVVPPTKTCCDAIAGADIECLCTVKKYAYLLKQYNVDPTLALGLPKACDLDKKFSCGN